MAGGVNAGTDAPQPGFLHRLRPSMGHLMAQLLRGAQEHRGTRRAGLDQSSTATTPGCLTYLLASRIAEARGSLTALIVKSAHNLTTP